MNKRIINMNTTYNYYSREIRPSVIVEVFPARLPEADLEPLKQLDDDAGLAARMEEMYDSVKDEVDSALEGRGFSDSQQKILFFTDLLHRAVPFTPMGKRETAANKSVPQSLREYLDAPFAGCDVKAESLLKLLKTLDIKCRYVQFADTQNWSHAFMEVDTGDGYEMYCPTFNLWMKTNIDEIIEDPWRTRKFMELYSSEFCLDTPFGDDNGFEEFIDEQADANDHTVFKYNRSWFTCMGYYPMVPPSVLFQVDYKPYYDMRKDDRYLFVKQ
ncbi:hypothetical protein [Limisalsivibrio acetivorans]|uniref:hypothetical protein n=1 Tax=Limisalsivibrio acetivorans TaxID=1304888 RepID=UPI0003B4DA95|nr:hypothetical protein [Limisalsivibrio acetivorans]